MEIVGGRSAGDWKPTISLLFTRYPCLGSTQSPAQEPAVFSKLQISLSLSLSLSLSRNGNTRENGTNFLNFLTILVTFRYWIWFLLFYSAICVSFSLSLSRNGNTRENGTNGTNFLNFLTILVTFRYWIWLSFFVSIPRFVHFCFIEEDCFFVSRGLIFFSRMIFLLFDQSSS